MTSVSLFAKARAPALVAALALAFAGSASAASLTENFDGGIPAGWTITNNSSPIGSTTWFQGNPLVFDAHAGDPDSYAGVNFNSTSGAGNISNWLILPTMSFSNGDTISFFTRTADASIWPDRLEVRFSATGGTNVGASAASVGSFTTLLLSVNPDLDVGGYPEAWTQQSVVLSGLAGATNGAIAFRYFVPDGGPLGDNSNYIGVDTLSITAAVPEPTTWALMALGLGAVALRRKRVS
jgi:hypothetical protein